MRLGGESAEARPDAMVSMLGKYSLHHPQAETLYRSAGERHIPDLLEHTTSALVDGCTSAGFQNHGRVKLKYIPKGKEDLDRAIKGIIKASTEYALVETSDRQGESRGLSYKLGARAGKRMATARRTP